MHTIPAFVLEDTSLYFFNLKLMEPMAAVTDLVVTITGIYIFRKLRTEVNANWPWFFFFLAMSSFIGAFAHIFRYEASDRIYMLLWLGMQLLSGISVYFAERGTIESCFRNKRNIRGGRAIILIQLIAFFVITLYSKHFLVVIVNTAIGLSSVMVVNLIHYKKIPATAIYISTGILVGMITGVIHQTRFSIHAWFNFKDISHLLITVSICLMFAGIRRLKSAVA